MRLGAITLPPPGPSKSVIALSPESVYSLPKGVEEEDSDTMMSDNEPDTCVHVLIITVTNNSGKNVHCDRNLVTRYKIQDFNREPTTTNKLIFCEFVRICMPYDFVSKQSFNVLVHI